MSACKWCDEGHEKSGGWHNVFEGPADYHLERCEIEKPDLALDILNEDGTWTRKVIDYSPGHK